MLQGVRGDRRSCLCRTWRCRRAVKRNAQGRRRDKHKKSEQDASQAAVAEEPEQQRVDEETLRQEREEALRRWREEQRKKYPVAPDGRLCYALHAIERFQIGVVSG